MIFRMEYIRFYSTIEALSLRGKIRSVLSPNYFPSTLRLAYNMMLYKNEV